MLLSLQFQVALQHNQKFREVYKWSELYCFYVWNTYLLPFKNAVGCFKGVVVCFSCICFFWCYLAFLKD